ncbi:M28 family metallopeptidase [Hirschia baltica]|uniref:Peptidase M28 n=1 Tax=Hirschia baltica (strain ATCC 49814 / DSM 5838 / IFAM 1418) TaxID=582402 RepID=C6XM35_HIRBI|nr:M28 family metallopeptidase [Hirschia baltica]ACT59867.1 peptidase M28 [Hirschia baltica ATCC 49814]
MRLKLIFALAAASVLGACASVEVSEEATIKNVEEILTPRAARIKADITYLASDELEGRETGSAGHALAVQYVINQFKEIGVAPAGEDGGYTQTVPFISVVRDEYGNAMQVINASGDVVEFIDGTDYVVYSSSKSPENVIEAPVVFAGYGVVAPEHGLTPYADIDVAGKIVAVLSGTPGGIQTEERAYYGAQVSREMSERGAIGVITLPTPKSVKRFPFARAVSSSTTRKSMKWIGKDGAPYTTAPNLAASAYLSDDGAAKLFDGSQMSWADIQTLIEDDAAKVPSFELPMYVRIEQKSTHSKIESQNVLGMIEGSDPELKDQVIVLSAHVDHIGITQKSMEEDVINNGALDNAAGVSTLLEAARIIKSGDAPRRSVMFAVVTGEEKGLLGAQYFTMNPTIERANIVGNVNLDMPVLTYDFTDVVAFGGERSTMKSAIEDAISEFGVTLGEDPFPAQGLFTRSDHYRFVEIGVPSVFLATGFENGGEEAWSNHFANNYHKPSDEVDNGLLFNVADKFASINAKIAMTLANQDERPMWVKDDFFGVKFEGVMVSD